MEWEGGGGDGRGRRSRGPGRGPAAAGTPPEEGTEKGGEKHSGKGIGGKTPCLAYPSSPLPPAPLPSTASPPSASPCLSHPSSPWYPSLLTCAPSPCLSHPSSALASSTRSSAARASSALACACRESWCGVCAGRGMAWEGTIAHKIPSASSHLGPEGKGVRKGGSWGGSIACQAPTPWRPLTWAQGARRGSGLRGFHYPSNTLWRPLTWAQGARRGSACCCCKCSSPWREDTSPLRRAARSLRPARD